MGQSFVRDFDALALTRAEPLIPALLVRRYQRFLADVQLDDGRSLTAHCVNTGAMEGLVAPGTRVYLRDSQNPARKLRYTWELAEIDGHLVGVDTSLPNRVVRHLLLERVLPGLDTWTELKPEPRLGATKRSDFLLVENDARLYVEVKNCHLVYPDGIAYFPDCVSDRAAEHLRELTAIVQNEGARAAVLFFMQLPQAAALRPSDVHDPTFAAEARAAVARGVEFAALRIRHTLEAIYVDGLAPVDLEPYALDDVQRWREANALREGRKIQPVRRRVAK